jgi:starvation-inducible outer membrane lipoprotein
MRIPTTLATLATALLLSACASVPQTPDGTQAIPEGAVESVHTESNGDTVSEYRVAGQLRVVKVVPVRGPTYYLIDRNGDGRVDPKDGGPATYYKLFSW